MRKPRLFFQILSLLWILFAVGIYFLKFTKIDADCSLTSGCLKIANQNWKIVFQSSHSYIKDSILTSTGSLSGGMHMPGPIYFIFAGVLFVYIANFFYDRFIERKKELSLNLSPFVFLLIFSLIFVLVYNRWEVFYNLNSPIKHHGIFLRYPVLILEFLGIFWVVLTAGRRLLNLFDKKNAKESLNQLILSSAVGITFLMLAFYFLALFGQYNSTSVIVFFSAIILFCSKDSYFWLKNFFAKSITIQSKYFSPYILLLIVSIIFIAQNFLSILRPIPIGFDDLNVYMNNAKLMAEKGHLISGAMSYYAELFTGLGYLFKNPPLAFLLALFSGILSIIAIYYLVNDYCCKRGFSINSSRTYAIFSTVLFYTLPLVAFPSSQDMKVDLMGFFLSMSSLILIWQWREKYLGGKNNLPLLFLSGFLAGVGVAVKYTNLLFAFVLLVYLILIVYRKNKLNLKKYLAVIFFGAAVILPVTPISIRNIYQTRSLAVADIRFGKADNQKLIADPAFDSGKNIEANFDKYMRERRTGDKVEVGRYLGYDNKLKKYLLLPLRLTSNSLVYGPYLNIGYLFLAFIPLTLLIVFSRKKLIKSANGSIISSEYDDERLEKTKSYFYEIFFLAVVFWLGWLFTASGIIWYGLSGFIFLLILTIEAYHYIRYNFAKPFVFFTHTIVVIWLILALFLRFSYLPSQNIMTSPDNLKYARGEITDKDVTNTFFGRYLSIIDQMNQDILSHPDNPPKIYRVGTFYKYFIANNDQVVCDDQLLDKFAYAYQDRNDEKMLQRLKNNNIKYIIFDISIKNVDKSPDQTLFKKYEDFRNFVNNNSKNFVLLSDPYDEKTLMLQIYY